MPLEQKLVMAEKAGTVTAGIRLLEEMLHMSLNKALCPSSDSAPTSKSHAMVAALSDTIREYAGAGLLNALRLYLPLDTAESITARSPPPTTRSGCMVESYVTLLRVLAQHGPARGTQTRGIIVECHGALVRVYLAESADGITLARRIGHDTVNDYVTGFEQEPTDEQLEALGRMTMDEVSDFVETHPLVSSAILTMLSGISGTASAPVFVSYRAKLGTAADVAEARKPLEAMVKCCANCLESGKDCVRGCDTCTESGRVCTRCEELGITSTVASRRPCIQCVQKKTPCIVGELLTYSSDCESGERPWAAMGRTGSCSQHYHAQLCIFFLFLTFPSYNFPSSVHLHEEQRCSRLY